MQNIYISMIKTKEHEWKILNAVDSRRKKKGKMKKRVGVERMKSSLKQTKETVELREWIREREGNENFKGLW